MIFWSLKSCFFAKLGWSEFHGSCAKNDFLAPEKLFFAKLGWSEFHKVSVQKNNFLEPEKLFFGKAGLV